MFMMQFLNDHSTDEAISKCVYKHYAVPSLVKFEIPQANRNRPVYDQRKPSLDQSCNTTIIAVMAGYCEVRNRLSGAIYRVMSTACDGQDIDLLVIWHKILHIFPLLQKTTNTIQLQLLELENHVTLCFQSTQKRFQLLRSYDCDLPIELFYRPEEMNSQKQFYFATFAHLRAILFLDCHNISLRDPTYLFDLLNASTSSNTLFQITPESQLWEYLDIPYVNVFEQDSGQLLIDKKNLLENLDLGYGDEDLFR
ncbi:hypothetical protein THRCLA_21609 [Thraustotheca clavata]|uniref:Uncharacterized protein n=1 Tax=Thraustotheca clavata TaxID=74557 RepID=A0A1V9ZUX3_9STRA|nr:hypothetical protein THRCLA_21609 [Thraustotheca clavata]